MQGFDFTKFKEELGKRGFKVREARASTGKLNGYYVTARSGTESVSYTHLDVYKRQELCTVAGHWQSQQSGNQGSHGLRIEEDAGL